MAISRAHESAAADGMKLMSQEELTMKLVPWQSKTKRERDGDSMAPTLARFRSDIEDLFDHWRGTLGFESEGWDMPGLWQPRLDVSEAENHVTIRAEVPGMEANDLDITLSGNVLTLSGEKRDTRERKDEVYFVVERTFGSFRRSVTLPAEVDADDVNAEYDKGVVTISIKKKHSTPRKRIGVKVKS